MAVRQRLAETEGSRNVYTGTFKRFGKKSSFGYEKTTVLLDNICDALGGPVCDHLWFNLTKAFEQLELKAGDRVAFHARSAAYLKGYRGRRDDVYDAPITKDFKLSHPTKVVKL